MILFNRFRIDDNLDYRRLIYSVLAGITLILLVMALTRPSSQPPDSINKQVTAKQPSPAPKVIPSFAGPSNVKAAKISQSSQSPSVVNQSTTSLTVNGQAINVPRNGSLHTQAGNASVDVKSTSSSSSQSTTVNVYSSSSSISSNKGGD